MRLGFELAMQFWIQTKANEAAAAASDWVWVETQHTIDCVISGQKFDETKSYQSRFPAGSGLLRCVRMQRSSTHDQGRRCR